MSTRQPPFQPIMVPPNATISSSTPRARQATAIRNREFEIPFVFTGDANLQHQPEYWVGIFNVSDQEHRIERPWVNPGSMGKLIVVPARESGELVSKPFLIPDIVQMPSLNIASGEMSSRGNRAEFLAQDALNPEDMHGSWKTVRTVLAAALYNENTNLYHLGCFWEKLKTKTDLPSDEATDKAIERMEATYNRWIDEAQSLALQGESGVKQIGHTHRRAANYFGRTFTWNQRYTKQNECPSCGRALPVTASRCAGPNGCGHVFNWEKAIADGVANVEEAIAAGINVGQAVDMGNKASKKKKVESES